MDTVRNKLSHKGENQKSKTVSPCGTVRSGQSRMGQVHHRHTQPMWYSPQWTVTHGASTPQTHTAHVVLSAADSHAWDKYVTDKHSPGGTVRSRLSHMGQLRHRHTSYVVICIQYESLSSPTNTTKTLYLQVVLYSTPSSSSHHENSGHL